MTLPTAYLTSFKNTEPILRAVQAAQAPERFTQKFLEGLGFASTNDRAVINVFKALGFLDDSGVPTSRYHRYLDQSQSSLVLAEGVRDAYADLFRINRNAHSMPKADVKGKMKTLSEGAFTDRVLDQMSGTFVTLAKLGDFVGNAEGPSGAGPSLGTTSEEPASVDTGVPAAPMGGAPFAALAYNINIQLPESRDPAVYNAIFKALREHFR